MLWLRTWLARRLVDMAARLNPATVKLAGNGLYRLTQEENRALAAWASSESLHGPGCEWCGPPTIAEMPTSEPPPRGPGCECSDPLQQHLYHLGTDPLYHHPPCPLAAPAAAAGEGE